MSKYWRDQFRKARGIGIYIYDTKTGKLVFISDSIQYLVDHIGIHRSTILRYNLSQDLYLSRFRIVRDYIPELNNENPLNFHEFKELLTQIRKEHSNAIVQPKSKPLLAVNIVESRLTRTYPSILSFSRSVQGDVSTIKKYIGSDKLYRKQ